MLNQTDVLIVGGGISGLSAANILTQKGYSVILVDSSSHMGGCIETFQSKLNSDTFIEMGAHSCYNSYQGLIDILGGDFTPSPLAKLPFGQIENGKIKPWHKGISFFELLFSLPKMWGANKFNKTIKEHFGMLSGVKNYQSILRHFFDAVACQDTSEFPSNALFKKRAGRNKSYPRKFSHQNGLSEIIKNLLNAKFQRLNNTKIRAICESKKPDFKWNIQSECGKDLFCNKVIFATSAEVVQSIIQPLFPNVIFPKFEEHRFSSLTLIVQSSSISLKKFSFAVSLQGVFHSVVSGDILDRLNNSESKTRSFTFHSRNAKKSEAELIEEALKVIGADYNDILESKLKPHTLPSYTLDHNQKINFFKDQISDLYDDLKITGNWIDGMSIEDCVQTTQKELENF